MLQCMWILSVRKTMFEILSSLTSEDVAYGPPANTLPSCLSLSPINNNLMLLYPDPRTGQRQLYQYHPNIQEFKLFVNIDMTGELSQEEKLRRERMRLFTQGITSYSWGNRGSNEDARLMIPMNGQIIVIDPKYNKIVIVYDGKLGAAIDPSWSPNGKLIALVINRDLYYLSIPGNLEKEVLDFLF